MQVKSLIYPAVLDGLFPVGLRLKALELPSGPENRLENSCNPQIKIYVKKVCKKMKT
jgi:hypothetical protein